MVDKIFQLSLGEVAAIPSGWLQAGTGGSGVVLIWLFSVFTLSDETYIFTYCSNSVKFFAGNTTSNCDISQGQQS